VIALRPLRWPDDRLPLLRLDTSFATDRIVRLERTEDGVRLNLATADPPIHKSYSLAGEIDAIPQYDWVRIAELDDEIAGVATMAMETWNRRAVLRHLYVTSKARRIGVGQALITAALEAAREMNARCLWVETQTINYAAVEFYRWAGFAWCGFDTSLYDPNEVGVDEVALFFCTTFA
jgi:ribosomal protein S18 acetylase RimI-like enzyme